MSKQNVWNLILLMKDIFTQAKNADIPILYLYSQFIVMFCYEFN